MCLNGCVSYSTVCVMLPVTWFLFQHTYEQVSAATQYTVKIHSENDLSTVVLALYQQHYTSHYSFIVYICRICHIHGKKWLQCSALSFSFSLFFPPSLPPSPSNKGEENHWLPSGHSSFLLLTTQCRKVELLAAVCRPQQFREVTSHTGTCR